MAKSLAVKERDAALAEMNKPLRTAYNAIVTAAQKKDQAEIWAVWEIGQQVQTVTGDERKYGEGAMSTLATALSNTGGVGHVAPSTLYAYRDFAKAYPKKLLEQLLARELPDGSKISYTHLSLLSPVTKPQERNEILKRIFKEGLSTSDTALLLQQKFGKRGGGGRQVQLPKTISAGLGNMGKWIGEIHKRTDLWDKAVFKRVAEASSDDLSPDTLKQIRDASKEVQRAQQDLTRLASGLEKAEARTASVIKKASPKKPAADKPAAKKTTKKKAVTKTTSAADRIANAKAKKKAAKKKTAKKKTTGKRVAATA